MASNRTVKVGEFAAAVNACLKEYSEAATAKTKAAVKKAGRTATQEINASAPVRTGRYKGSWRSKTTAENYLSLEVTVHSPTRYMLAHLLEHGHAKRGGGRTRAFPHIAPAEKHAMEQLLIDVEKALKG